MPSKDDEIQRWLAEGPGDAGRAPLPAPPDKAPPMVDAMEVRRALHAARRMPERRTSVSAADVIKPPSYWAIRFIGTLYVCLGFLGLAGGIAFAIWGALVASAAAPEGEGALVWGAWSAWALVWGVLGGVASIAAGQLLYAIRDIAINTWSLRKH